LRRPQLDFLFHVENRLHVAAPHMDMNRTMFAAIEKEPVGNKPTASTR
jgi:hypothetical protein